MPSAGAAGAQRPCAATTQRGAPCQSFALAGGYCSAHDPNRAEERRAARSRGATNANKLRALRGRQAKLDSPAALLAFNARVIGDLLDGTLHLDVARAVVYALTLQKGLVEASDTEQRLAALEERLAAEQRGGRPWAA